MKTREPNNSDRADWANAAVIRFREVCGGSPLDDPEGVEEAIGDLIGDLLHLAASEELDPIDIVRRAICSYADERDYPPDGWAPADKIAHCDITLWKGKLGK